MIKIREVHFMIKIPELYFMIRVPGKYSVELYDEYCIIKLLDVENLLIRVPDD